MHAPQVSIVLETDDLRSANPDRAVSVLAELGRQLLGLERNSEVLIAFDPDAIEDVAIRALVEQSGLAAARRTNVRIEPARGLRYYDAKNQGVRRARGEIVLLLDCDCVLEEGWLESFLAAFDDPRIQIASGSTYTDVSDRVMDKSYSLFWNFDLRRPDGPPVPHTRISSNNFGGRRDFLRAHPFPSDDRYRGQCASLATRLIAEGEMMWRIPTARAAHPIPEGFVARRAMWQGHDRLRRRQQLGQRPGVGVTLRMLASDVKRSVRRIRHGRRQVELRLWEVPLALTYAIYYHVFSWLGAIVTLASPAFLARRLPL